MNVSIKKYSKKKTKSLSSLNVFQLSKCFLLSSLSRRMSNGYYAMQQPAVYIDQRFSPTLVVETTKNFDGSAAFNDPGNDCDDELRAKN